MIKLKFNGKKVKNPAMYSIYAENAISVLFKAVINI